MLPAEPAILAAWFVATAAIAWRVVLTKEDRRELGSFLRRLLYSQVDSPR